MQTILNKGEKMKKSTEDILKGMILKSLLDKKKDEDKNSLGKLSSDAIKGVLLIIILVLGYYIYWAVTR